ncbi:MAG TPA: nucleotidyltransferase domain-containing protein [Chloroflexota bacterium]|nr:nucleotidyltransferase domain-containing protein [Chloroflexota bacterium]
MATARELGPAGWRSYRGPTSTPRAQLTPAERDQLLNRIRLAAERLKQLGARRVVLFGSLARGDWTAPLSDVDLAVADLPAGAYWEGWRLAEEAVGDVSVDLIALERASEPLRRAVERDGVEL